LLRLALPALLALALAAPGLALAGGPPGDAPAPRLAAAFDLTALDAESRARFGDQAIARWDTRHGVVRSLRRLAVPTEGIDAPARALHFVTAHRDLLARDLPAVFEPTRAERSPTGGQVVQLRPRVDGLLVEHAVVAVELDAEGRVRSLRADPLPLGLGPATGDIGAEAARAAATERLGMVAGGATPVIFTLGPDLARRAYRVPLVAIPMVAHYLVWIDAEDATVLRVAAAGNDQVPLSPALFAPSEAR